MAVLGGIIPPLVTPLSPSREFDADAARRLAAHVLAGGAHGLLVTGSNGEVAALPGRIRSLAIASAVEATNNRVPVIVGVARVNFEETLSEIEGAAEAGAAAVLVTPPYYSPVDQAAIRSFYLKLAESSRLPILVYNIPAFTKVSVAPETVAELAADWRNHWH